MTVYFGAKQQNYTQRTDSGTELAGFVKSRFANAVYLSDGTIATPTLTIPSGDFAGTTSFFQLGTSNDWIRKYDFLAANGVDAFQPGDYTYAIGGTSVTLSPDPPPTVSRTAPITCA